MINNLDDALLILKDGQIYYIWMHSSAAATSEFIWTQIHWKYFK